MSSVIRPSLRGVVYNNSYFCSDELVSDGMGSSLTGAFDLQANRM